MSHDSITYDFVEGSLIDCTDIQIENEEECEDQADDCYS